MRRSTLVDVRATLVSGGYAGIGAFAVAVRDVFAACYMTHGHPDRSALSKKCAPPPPPPPPRV